MPFVSLTLTRMHAHTQTHNVIAGDERKKEKGQQKLQFCSLDELVMFTIRQLCLTSSLKFTSPEIHFPRAAKSP